MREATQYGRARKDLVFDAVGAADGSLYLVGFAFYAVDFDTNPIDLGTSFSSYAVMHEGRKTAVATRFARGAMERHELSFFGSRESAPFAIAGS